MNRTRVRFATWCFQFLVLLHPGLTLAQEATFDSSRFEPTVLANGLMRPMELELAADGTIYFIELEGDLKAIDPVSRTVRDVGKLTVTTEQENGLIGMALDPDFSVNNWIYLQYSPPDFEGQYISRFTLVDGLLDPTTEKRLFRYEEQRKQCCHHAGALQFGPDGCLYISTGDNTNPFDDSRGYAPIDERPGREPWDAQRTSANSRSGNGKILRIRPLPDGTYEVPDDNLFPKDGSKGLPEIYVMGCRNPWRISIDPDTNFLYWGDVGPDAGGNSERGPRGHDEINQARAAGFFGWPYFNADNQPYADVNFETGDIGPLFDPLAPVNDSVNNTGERQLPPAQPALIFYPSAASDTFPELASGGRTACAGPVYHFDPKNASETKFPAGLDRVLFIYEWSRHWVKLVFLDEHHQVAAIEPFMPDYPFRRPIDMNFGPEGALYMLEYGETWGVNPDARLIRIDYVRGNRAPVVVAKAENNIGRHPLNVTLSGEGSFDRDNDRLKWEWRLINTLDLNAEPRVVSNEPDATITIAEPGVYNAELTVTDAAGAFRSAAVPVLVGNERPSVTFASPQSGDFFDADRNIRYEIIVRDAEDGTNDEEAFENGDSEIIDGESPGRVILNARHSPDVFSLTGPAMGSGVNDPPGLKRMKASDCFNCHAVDQKRVGPQLIDIATKYRDKPDALEASVQRVLKGSTGVWGKIPMIPHSQHSPEELREMVGWIYSLQPSGLVRVFSGFVGEIPVPTREAAAAGHYRLDVSYTDRGAGAVPALNASASVYLRPRLVEAESADEVNGPQLLNSGRASGGRFVGAINHGHTLRFRNMNLDQLQNVTLKIASAGAGGAIEIRLDQPDGPLLAAVDVEVNGDWEGFYERSIALNKTPTPVDGSESTHISGRHDLVIVFTHPSGAGGLMNLDALQF
ncbi:MAG: PQQ-dependent sugar dehydrogenase [Fuerstiella sp.]